MYPLLPLGLLALISPTIAHTVFTTLFINDVNQGDGTCVRMPLDDNTCTNPIEDLSSQDMACGRDGSVSVAFTCPSPAGAKLTFTFREFADASEPGAIDVSHKGPCSVYAKQMSNMTTSSAAGDGWFKIWESGYDQTTGQWCTEKLIANKGLLSVNLPTALPTGYYLVRPELLALQEADKGDPQFYTGCAQLFVQGTASGTLDIPADRKVSIPGHVKAGDKSVAFNIYDQKLALPYPIPGPKVFFPVLAGTAAGKRAEAVQQTQGLIPDACLLKNANWCGYEVPSYKNEDGCWSSSEACWEQAAACYKSAPPSGSANCVVWEGKCTGIQDACNARQFNGPPNQGKKLMAVQAKVPGPIPAAEVVQGTTVTVGGGGAAATTTSPASSSVGTTVSGAAGGALTTVKAPAPTSTSMSPTKLPTPASPSVSPTKTPAVVGGSGAATSSKSPAPASPSVVKSPSASTPTGVATPKPTTTSCPALVISKDGTCGGDLGQICEGSKFGPCCGSFGKCGSSKLYCGCGCQDTFGRCN